MLNKKLDDWNDLLDNLVILYKYVEDRELKDFILICIKDAKLKIHRITNGYVDGR